MGNDLVVGNVNQKSIREIAKSQKREALIAALEAQDFEQIGFPCSRVDACQVITTS